MKEKLQFRVSSATKSILGKDLIVDKNIAIFELVKNTYDACAKRVDIYISDEKIVITDDGDGMSICDIKNKWLYVGYSEKIDQKNNIIKSCKRRTFAGAKGIGRLACDRLGENLILTSIKNKKIEQLDVKWGDFEKDSRVDFNKIDIVHTSLKQSPNKDFKKGTMLEVTALREKWDEDDVKKIETHLTKLISPVKESKEIFDIFIHHNEKETLKVENFIFDKLGLKTTKIDVSVSEDGKFITTELIDRGDRIYKVIEKNKWSPKIANIKIQLFYLSPPTKLSFWHSMKIDSVNFGSVFLYKNGFRVFPYGEPNDDSLGIDRRKGQGRTRYFGTREVIGNIIINSATDEFKETSSRDGGLLNTKGFQDLKDLFKKNVLRRLEIYTVDTLTWTYNTKTKKEFFPTDRKNEIKELIQKLTKSRDFVNLEYDYSTFEKKIEKKVNEGFQGATGVLKKQAKKTGDEKLLKAVKKIEKVQDEQTNIIKKQRDKIEESEEDSSALRSLLKNPFFENIVDFHHDILMASKSISSSIDDALIKLTNKDYKNLSNILEIIKFENSKIFSISRIATKSGMKDGVHKKRMALNKKVVAYLEEYNKLYSKLNIKINDNTEKDFIISFRYYDIVTVLDNLLDNSGKHEHEAKNIEVVITDDKKWLEISFSDDGKGLDKKFANNPDDIFKSRTSTTNGAGWGLYQIREILKEMNGNISVSPQKKGISFNLYFKK